MGLLDEFYAPDYSRLKRGQFRQDTPKMREYAANVPVDLARGTVAGLLGLLSDTLNFAPAYSPKPMEQFGDFDYAPSQKVPFGSEELLKTLPLAPAADNPVGRVAGQIGTFAPMLPVQAARLAGRGAAEVGKFVAPKAGQFTENYMQRMGMMPSIVKQSGRGYKITPQGQYQVTQPTPAMQTWGGFSSEADYAAYQQAQKNQAERMKSAWTDVQKQDLSKMLPFETGPVSQRDIDYDRLYKAFPGTLVTPSTARTMLEKNMLKASKQEKDLLRKYIDEKGEWIPNTESRQPTQILGGPLSQADDVPPSNLAMQNVAEYNVGGGLLGDAAAVAKAPNINEFEVGGLLSPSMPINAAQINTLPGATYATKQEGPFYRVSPTSLDVSGGKNRGLRETPELQAEGVDPRAGGQVGSEVPIRVSDEEVARIISNPETNQPLQIARQFTRDTQGTEFTAPDIPQSSLAKQSAIGRAHQLAVEGSPEYKTSVFDAYAKQMPDLLEQSGAKNYDDLMEKAYRQLAKETDEQFQKLPYNFSYHRAGEGDYRGSKEMMADVHSNKHLYVFQGGDPHDFLNRIDKASGLNENEKFRAVHDLLGHAVFGNQFGPKGEELAYAVHQQMYSPLARLAMASETRGQNSLVNYSPLNVKMKSNIAKFEEAEYIARRQGDTALVKEIQEAKKQEFSNFQFAPQKAVLLPPEFIDPKFAGGFPEYLSSANRPTKGTETQSVLTHFSNDPNLQFIDPTRYGTGIKGAEASRLRDFAGGVKDRSYFYLGEPGIIAPEPGLGSNIYRGQSQNLYDITQDPLSFRALARESNRTPFSARANAGITSPLQEANDYERLVKEYGYEGMINPNASKPMGIMFRPTSVQPRNPMQGYGLLY